MKFSIASTLLLAQGIAAMPWSSIAAKQSNGEEITLRIQVSQASNNHGFTTKGTVNPNHYDVCLKVCWPEEPKCPEGWDSKKFGDDGYPCWTCCKKNRDDDL
ncbi:putative pathogenicity protein [Fusarium austroafricanum]|uniref:Putative pathogenicity protein n=1 Tax=Fusarium austroafricanum TaxID=2364996 RepID=A0A8H4JR77_9HYPO|nr:putative pathogenicity protein [Fusarium austroafricanum]